MPIYEFRCSQCGHEFETLVLRAGEDAVTCPVCNSKETKKILSAFSRTGLEKSLSASCGSSSHSGHS
jgi:putative FmdB family regulatory protein